MIELVRYQHEDGREPYTEWFRGIRDESAKIRIAARMRQIESGNLGYTKPVGGGEIELRIHVGAGYRVYCGQHGQCLVISPLRRGQRLSIEGHSTSQDALGRLEKEATMKKLVGAVSHHEREVEELREDRAFAVGYLQVAMESLDNPEERGGALLSLRALAEAYGGLANVASSAGISRESLYRALSPKGNPTLKTLLAVVKAVGLRLSVKEAEQVKAEQATAENDSAAA